MKPREIAELVRPGSRRARGPIRWVSVADAYRAAQRHLPGPVFEFIAGGAEDEATLRANDAARNEWYLVPRVLRNVARPDLRRQILGAEHEVPFVLGPTGFTGVVHPDGELAVTRAARAQRVGYTVSAVASNTALDDIVAVAPDGLWFNYYPLADAGRGKALLERAWSQGFRTLVVTVDVPVAGWRERDVRNGFSIPPAITPSTVAHSVLHPAWTFRFLRGPALTTPNVDDVDVLATSTTFPDLFAKDVGWSDIEGIRDNWSGPLVVKGVLSIDDARLAHEHGLDGVVVSNHGGRQLDGAPAAMRALEPIAQELRPNGVDVLVDSGFRRGRDIVTAVALGATGVLIGRPYLYGLAAGGQAGVERVIEILRAELVRCLHLMGLDSLAAIDRSAVQRERGR